MPHIISINDKVFVKYKSWQSAKSPKQYNMVSVEAKIDLIVEGIAEGLFGHIDTAGPYWSQLLDYCHQFLEVYGQTGHCQKLRQRVADVVLHHPLRKFPLSGPHLNRVLEW